MDEKYRHRLEDARALVRQRVQELYDCRHVPAAVRQRLISAEEEQRCVSAAAFPERKFFSRQKQEK